MSPLQLQSLLPPPGQAGRCHWPNSLLVSSSFPTVLPTSFLPSAPPCTYLFLFPCIVPRAPTPHSDGTLPPASPCIWSAAEAEEGSQSHVVSLTPHLVPMLLNIPVIHHHLAPKCPGNCLTKCRTGIDLETGRSI